MRIVETASAAGALVSWAPTSRRAWDRPRCSRIAAAMRDGRVLERPAASSGGQHEPAHGWQAGLLVHDLLAAPLRS